MNVTYLLNDSQGSNNKTGANTMHYNNFNP